jgi:uncharacterized membrane protein
MSTRVQRHANTKPPREDSGAIYRWWLLFALLLIACGLYVALSSASLPAIVASHFDGAGRANGTAMRADYRAFMTAFVVLLPLFVASVFSLVGKLPASSMNLPNREYWLAPERVAETKRVLVKFGHVLAGSLAIFLTYLHALVLYANKQIVPELPSLWPALGVFAAFNIGLMFALYRHFGKRAKP